MKLTRQKLLSL